MKSRTTRLRWVFLFALVMGPSGGAAEPIEGTEGTEALECRAEGTPVAVGPGTREPAPAVSGRCPRAASESGFDVHVTVDDDNGARVKGLGGDLRMTMLDLRTSRALADKRVLVRGDVTRAEAVVRLCAALRDSGVEALRPDRSLSRIGDGVHFVEPRRAYQLTRGGNQWINLTEESIELRSVSGMRQVPIDRYGDQVTAVLRKIVEDLPEDGALVLMDRRGEFEDAVAALSGERLGARTYYVTDGYAGWAEWRRMNRRIVLARASAGRARCAGH